MEGAIILPIETSPKAVRSYVVDVVSRELDTSMKFESYRLQVIEMGDDKIR